MYTILARMMPWIRWNPEVEYHVNWHTLRARARIWLLRSNLNSWSHMVRQEEWRWSGHVGRQPEQWWTRRAMVWDPMGGPGPGRPLTVWHQSIKDYLEGRGRGWPQATMDRDQWKQMMNGWAQWARPGIHWDSRPN